jgi:hypothetical protein
MAKKRFSALVLVWRAARRLAGCSTNRGPLRVLLGNEILTATERQDEATRPRRLRNKVEQSRKLQNETDSCGADSRISR